MSVRFEEMPRWVGADECTSGPQPGARAFMAYWLEQFEPLARSLGIYNCRNVAGSSTTSVHGEGRACDCAIPVDDEGHAVMWRFLELLAPHAMRLGIQLVIFDRTIWSWRREPEGEPYTGRHPHRDHAHIELTWAAAEKLTLATLRAVVGDFRDEEDEDEETEASGDWRKEIVDNMKTVNLSGVRQNNRSTYVPPTGRDRGVRLLQAALAANGHPPANSFDNRGRPDGVGGWHTRRALEAYQRAAKTGVPSNPSTPDAIAGPATWGALLDG